VAGNIKGRQELLCRKHNCFVKQQAFLCALQYFISLN